MRVNLVLVGVKLFIVLFVIVAGIGFVNTANYSPFVPPSDPGALTASGIHAPLIQLMFGLQPAAFGIGGIVAGASIVFFAYIGFDVVATTAEEARNPQRDLPRGIIASLIICTILYIAVALVITGMVPYAADRPQGGAGRARSRRVGKGGYATLISAGAVAGLMTVVMTLMIGATRVVFAMSRDWLLPRRLARTSQRTGTPIRITLDHRRDRRADRVADPDRQAGGDGQHRHAGRVHPGLDRGADPAQAPPRPASGRSRCRSTPYLPILAAVVCVYLMLNLSVETWIRFVIWMAAGLHHLLRLQPLPQPAGRRRGGRRPAGRRGRGPAPDAATRRTTTPRCPLGRRGVVVRPGCSEAS